MDLFNLARVIGTAAMKAERNLHVCMCVCLWVSVRVRQSSTLDEMREHLQCPDCFSWQTEAVSCETMHQHGDDTMNITFTTNGPSEPPASYVPSGTWQMLQWPKCCSASITMSRRNEKEWKTWADPFRGFMNRGYLKEKLGNVFLLRVRWEYWYLMN